jgi:hypothetical protein
MVPLSRSEREARCPGGLSGRWLPAPIGWGSERRGSASDAWMSPCAVIRQPPDCRTTVAGPGPHLSRAGLALARSGTPRAFHGLDEARSRANGNAGDLDRGACAGLSTLARPEHPSARRTTFGPVRTTGLPLRSTSRPRIALRRSLVAAPRCLETASTTDVSRHEHPMKEHHLRRPSAGRLWETRQRSVSRTPLDGGVSTFSVLGRSRTTSRSSGLRRPRA